MQIKAKVNEEQLKKKNPERNISVKHQYWIEKKIDSEKEKNYVDKGIDPIFAKLLILRSIDIDNFEKYFNPKIRDNLPDPYIIDEMELATKKIIECIKEKKKIGIFGDYDVDGTTSTVLLSKYFQEIGAEFEFYIPDRLKEGYGPSIQSFAKMIDNNCKLIITLDCGTSALEEILFSKKKNVEVIVVDHHKEGAEVPQAYALVNPNKKNDNSNLNNLCAAGVTFLLLVSLNRVLKEIKIFKENIPNLISYLDLVALGTICDLVKLDYLNRTFVKQGIKVLNASTRIGISSIVKESKIFEQINDYHLGYIIGPRINAGGRVGKSSLGTELLLCNEQEISDVMALKLGEFNNLRKSIEKEVELKAFQMVQDDNKIICVNSKNWHPGVIGIVASKLTEKFNRPSIVISEGKEVCKASCRSTLNFDIGNLIVKAVNENLLLSGGGHKMAGGFSIQKNNIQKFKNYLSDKYLKETGDITKKFDCILKILNLDNDLYDNIMKLAPFGPGNPKPKFLLEGCNLEQIRIIANNHHSIVIQDIYGNRARGIVFNSVNHDLGKFFMNYSGENVDLILVLKKNEWNGDVSIQVQVEDIIVN